MSKKILLADDSITIQKVVSLIFSKEDYELIMVGDGNKAISRATEVRPDLIMADVAMPGRTGYEVCEVVKNVPALKHIPVLLLTGAFDPLNEKEFARVKADDHIVKPFESQELIDKVKNLLARSVAPPEEISFEVEEAAPSAEVLPPGDIWEIGDFIGMEETPASEKVVEGWGTMGEKDFLEETREEALKKEEEFIELELTEEELTPIEEVEPLEAGVTEASETFEAIPEITPEPEAIPVSEVVIPAIEAEMLTEEVELPIREKVEEKAREVMAEEVTVPTVSKEKMEELVLKVARAVVEEVVWEVVPELAEELIKEEIRKVKEAIAKAK
ncbi:MAG: response regulator [Deltaproteobacteria bacterium]|nr:response regulator [Deltaproteobacteria bacterium]